MNQTTPKQAPIRLEEENYRGLRKRVLRRDGWRCQLCGSMTNLKVHHKEFRSHSGEDSDRNLIVLCLDCHASSHGLRIGKVCKRSELGVNKAYRFLRFKWWLRQIESCDLPLPSIRAASHGMVAGSGQLLCFIAHSPKRISNHHPS
jgi:hypothetical protein